MKRFVLLALATLAGYVAAMAAIITVGSGIDLYMLGGFPDDRFDIRIFVISALIAVLGVLGHVAILRRVE